MRSPTTHKMCAVKNLDKDVEDIGELSSHDGCFCHVLNYSFWLHHGANVSFSTSQLSESSVSHHVCHDVVKSRSGVMKIICAKGNSVPRSHTDIMGCVPFGHNDWCKIMSFITTDLNPFKF